MNAFKNRSTVLIKKVLNTFKKGMGRGPHRRRVRLLFETLSRKLGVVLLVLGVMHLGNVYTLNKFRRRGMADRGQLPPVPPQGWPVAPHGYPVPHGPWAAPTGQ